MTITLESLKQCLQGVIPSVILTCAKDGTPNVAFLSHVHYVDSKHIALSTQYFNKTKKNLLENPNCTVRLSRPDSFLTYRAVAKHVRTETSGPLFEDMKTRLAAIADYSGASDFLVLKAIEILEVVDLSLLAGEAMEEGEIAVETSFPSRKFTVDALQKVIERVKSSPTLDEVFDSILQAMDLEFSLRHSMILLSDSSNRLLTIATRGYEQSGVGAEVKFGEGVIGRAAESKIPITRNALSRDLIYGRSAVKDAKEKGLEAEVSEAIKLPGLATAQSQIAVPLVIRNELLGVLFAESENVFEFREGDDQLLATLGSVLAMAISSLQILHRAGEEPAPAVVAPAIPDTTERLLITYYEKDDCLFVNGEYLIRNVPARILWKLLNQFKATGKVEFTNRELRMDSALQLPEIKDNLETRLILLRKRLEKKCPSVKITPIGRGRFCIKATARVDLELG